MTQIYNNILQNAATAYYFIRPKIINSLEKTSINELGRNFLEKDYTNFCEYWEATGGMKLYDMTIMIQLGAAVEDNLRNKFMRKKDYTRSEQLDSDPNYRRGAFQRIMPDQQSNDSAFCLFNSVGININNLL